MSVAPLAERMRPNTLDELVGQQHLTGQGSILRTAIGQGKLPSMILWGPPGVGKTTIANIIAHTLNVPFYTLSAISAGVKDVREVIEDAKSKPGAILFIDEIHRFNKGQQDALLGAVEKGIIRLIGATTENPSFEVNSALLSGKSLRCKDAAFLRSPFKAAAHSAAVSLGAMFAATDTTPRAPTAIMGKVRLSSPDMTTNPFGASVRISET